MEKTISEIEREIINTFASMSESLGYSEVHGKILAALIISGDVLSLEELAKKTRYSTSMISLSLDLLEVLGMLKKIKRPNDRKLYIQLDGDLVETIKTAIMLKISRGFSEVHENLDEYRNEIKNAKGSTEEKKKLLKNLGRLERESNRIKKYVEALSKVRIPR